MAGLVSEELERYVAERSTPADALLERLAEETRRTLPSPGMLSGPVEGRLLETLVFATGARRILEIGTYSGYATLSMAAALPPGGRIVTCELDERHAALARRYFAESPLRDLIDLRLGPALDTLATLDGPFDLVFIDADKTGYRAYYEASLELLADRGLIVVDNTLWGGRVLAPDGDAARAIAAFNDHIRADRRVRSVILTVRDGITLIRRA